MKILAVGDIVGSAGINELKLRLKGYIRICAFKFA